MLPASHGLFTCYIPKSEVPNHLNPFTNETSITYVVDILFFDRNVSGLLVAGDMVDFKIGIEANLTAILKPLGLHYKRVKNGGYVVVKESATKAETSRVSIDLLQPVVQVGQER